MHAAPTTIEDPVNGQVTTLVQEKTKGWIGERYDAGAGLQYLNARTYDPKLGLFLQRDWWEVTKAGVGTNLYAYAGNDSSGFARWAERPFR